MTPDQISAMQKDVSDMRQQMEALRKENGETAAKVEEVRAALTARQEDARAQSAEMKRQFEGLRDEMRTLDGRLDGMEQRLKTLSVSRAAAPAPATASTPQPPAAGGLSAPDAPGGAVVVPVPQPTATGRATGAPDDLFNQAYADYSKGNYAPSMLGFEEFLKTDPKGERSDDALYWIGLCHYDQGEYQEAITTFDRLIREFPEGDKVPAAHLKKGLSLLGMNRTAQGVVQLQYLVEHYPRSNEARIASDRLREMGVKP